MTSPRRRRGRPPLAAGDPSAGLHVRLPGTQFDALCQRASRARVSLATLARRVLLRSLREGRTVMLTIPDAGERRLLEALTGAVPASAWTLRLYTAVSPAISSSTVASHVVEASGGGYAPRALDPALWETAAGSPTSSTYPRQTFTFAGALEGNPAVLGYYLTDAGGTLLVIQELAEAVTPSVEGDVVDIMARIEFGSGQDD